MLAAFFYFLMPGFGTSTIKRIWAVGAGGTILESIDGQTWNPPGNNASASYNLRSIFTSGDGTRQWSVGEHGTILESENGGQWSALTSNTKNDLHAIYGTKDGAPLGCRRE